MFDAAHDAALGVHVEHGTYPEGEEGIQKSLRTICRKIREGLATAVMKSYAGNVLKQAGFPSDTRSQAAALLDHVRKAVHYQPDALGTEQIQTAPVSLCVEGAPICIPIGDCFPEGTLLLRRDGKLVPIEEIKVGEEIWGDKKWSRVDGKAFKGKLRVDAVEMNNGSTMYLTPEHKVYVGRCRHGKSVDCATCGARPSMLVESWDRIRIGDLQIGDALLQPERVAFGDGTTFEGSRTDHLDRLYIEGLAISEGWVDGSRFCISGQDGKRKEALKHEVKAICERLGIATGWHRKYIRINDGDWATRVASFGHRARNKHFETLDLAEDEAAALLRGIMSDSTANTRGEGRTYAMTSHMLMVQVRVLHRMFGRSTSVKMLTPERHRGAGKHPLWRVGVRVKSDEHELAKSDKTLAVRAIERAVKKVPCWDIQTDDHKVYLPEYDVTVSNCDDLVVALGTLCAAAGMDVEVIRQFFGDEHQQHVLVQVKSEDGSWFALDPSSKMPAGWKANAARETTSSPWDSAITGLSADAQFVGIGALPVYVYGRGWRQLPATASVEDGMRVVGAGSIWQGAAMLQPQLDWLGQFWRVIDAKNRDWAQATTDALARAESGNWIADDATCRSDLLALILTSAFQARAVQNMPELGGEWSDTLTRTWLVYVRKLGYDPSTLKPEDLRARLQKDGASQANIAVFDLLVILIAGLIGAVIFAIAFYAVSSILNNLVSKYFVDRELLRLHGEGQRIVDRHLADPNLPWTDGERQLLKDLQMQQAGLAQQQGDVPNTVKPFDPNAAAKGFWDSPWAWVGLATVVGGTVLAVVYRDELKRALESRRT